MAINITELANRLVKAGIPIISVRSMPPEIGAGWSEDAHIVYAEDVTVAQINQGEKIMLDYKAEGQKGPVMPTANTDEGPKVGSYGEVIE